MDNNRSKIKHKIHKPDFPKPRRAKNPISPRPSGPAREIKIVNMDENEIGTIVIETATEIHKELGPGLLETVYEIILSKELKDKGLKIKRQVPIPIHYKGIKFDEGFRADIIVNEKVILELKSIVAINNSHKKQLLTYLKLSNMKLGYLLNFGADLMKNGISRTVNGVKNPINFDKW